MLLIVLGLVVVFGSIVTGYVLEKGSLLVLVQPSELIIIGGGAIGIVLISSPGRNLRMLCKTILSVGRQRAQTQETYMEALNLLYVLFQLGRGGGKSGLESHVEAPQESEIFGAYPSVLADVPATNFICDSFRMAISAGLSSKEIARLMSLDIDVQRAGRQQPLRLLTSVAESLPGLGIVAAVLGVVVTMQALGGPVEDIGQKVAAALVGTFLGILLCYGVIGPLAQHLDALSRGRAEYLQVLRVAISSFFDGSTALVAAESARRSIPLDLRPTLEDMETELRRQHIPRPQSSPVSQGA